MLALGCTHPLLSQNKFEFGIGFGRGGHFFRPGRSYIALSDSVIISDNTDAPVAGVLFPLKHTRINIDPTAKAFVRYTLMEKKPFTFHISLFYYRKWMNINLHRLNHNPLFGGYTTNVPFVASNTFYFPAHVSFHPVRFFRLRAGAGPAFHIGGLKSGRIGFTAGPNNNRDFFYNEAYYQLQRIHRRVTFNYSLEASLDIFNSGLSLSFMQMGSIGKVVNDLEVFGTAYDVPAKWESLALFISYHFDLW